MHIVKVKGLADLEDDPPLIFGWENVDAFVSSVNIETPNLPHPFPIPALPITSKQFKLALLNHIRDQNDRRTIPVGTTVIPCTQDQCSHSIGKASALRFDPWFQAVAARPGTTPIAKVYVLRPHSSTVEEALRPCLPPAAPLWHDGV